MQAKQIDNQAELSKQIDNQAKQIDNQAELFKQIEELKNDIKKLTKERDEANRIVQNQNINSIKSKTIEEDLKEFLGDYKNV